MSKSSLQIPPWALKIEELRGRLKMKQGDMAASLRTSQANVSRWGSGKLKPTPEQFMKLAKLATGHPDELAFMEWGGVPASWFLGEGGDPHGLIPIAVAEQAVRDAKEARAAEVMASAEAAALQPAIRSFPLLRDAAAAGSPRKVSEKDIAQIVSLPKAWLPTGGNLFAIPVVGDSMSPLIETGHIAIVDVSRRDPKKLVERMVVARDGEGITIKWLRQDGDIYMLVPQHTSPAHPVKIMRPDSDMAIVGEVVKWIAEPPTPRK